MKKILLVGLVATMFGCAAPGSNFKTEDTSRIHPGMTEAQVIAILGEPKIRKQVANCTGLAWAKDYYAVNLYYSYPRTVVSFAFIDGKVVDGDCVNNLVKKNP